MKTFKKFCINFFRIFGGMFLLFIIGCGLILGIAFLIFLYTEYPVAMLIPLSMTLASAILAGFMTKDEVSQENEDV